MREDVPEDVSSSGFRATLKSPPSRRMPDWKEVRASAILRKKLDSS